MPEIAISESHVWVRKDSDDIVTIGLTDYGQDQLGDVVFVEPLETGRSYEAGEEAGVIESVKAAVNFVVPITGEVIEINEELEEYPELINDSPTDDGWICQMTLFDPAEFNDLMDEDEYDNYLASIL